MRTTETISHEESIELLPWLVNGSLGAAELEAVQLHARSCVACRRELDALKRLRDFVVDGAAAESIPEPDMRNINTRIDRLIEKQGWRDHLFSCVRAYFSSPWKLGFVVQTILIIGLTTVLLWPSGSEPEFTTLTQPEVLSGNHHFRVVFSPEVTLAELNTLLNDLDLRVETGPSAHGVYTLAVPATLSQQERAQLLGHLQSLSVVRFAQRVEHY